MPENLYFRQPSTQAMLLDILFVWSKLNADVGYRQGMHEILAPILWVVERDAIRSQGSHTTGEEAAQETLLRVYDSNYIEHDSFLLLSAIMDGLKSAYAPPKQDRPGTRERKHEQPTSQEPPIVTRARRIVQSHLSKADPPLAAHLIDLGIPSQLFIMSVRALASTSNHQHPLTHRCRRWIRLLFGREFPFEHVVKMWDYIIAEGATAECIDLVCVSMLLRVRWQRQYLFFRDRE